MTKHLTIQDIGRVEHDTDTGWSFLYPHDEEKPHITACEATPEKAEKVLYDCYIAQWEEA